MVGATARRRAATELVRSFELSERQACRLVCQSRSVFHYRPRRTSHELARRLEELAAERPRFGYRRLHALLVREGWSVNHKRILRLYQDLGLQVRRKKRKQAARASRKPKVAPSRRGESWSMDFMSDAFTDGRSFRLLNVVDDLTREAVRMEVGISLTASRVIRALDAAIEEYGKPRRITMDNGPEFTSRALDEWAYRQGVELHFIRPGKPTENAYAESFNGRVREECLNQHCFGSLEEARSIVGSWREDYNRVRPHSSLGNATPEEFAATLEEEGYPSSSPGAGAIQSATLNPQQR